MNISELLDDLARRDIRLSTHGERLRVDAPRGALPDGMLDLLTTRKAELLDYLQSSDAESETSFEAIESMSLDVFAKAGLIVRVQSEVLGKDVLFVSDNVPGDALAGRSLVAYRAHELRKLESIREPGHLRTIDATKAIFNGTVEEVR